MDLFVDFVVLLLFVRDKMWKRERERSMEREEYKREIQLVFIHLFFVLRMDDGISIGWIKVIKRNVYKIWNKMPEGIEEKNTECKWVSEILRLNAWMTLKIVVEGKP